MTLKVFPNLNPMDEITLGTPSSSCPRHSGAPPLWEQHTHIGTSPTTKATHMDPFSPFFFIWIEKGVLGGWGGEYLTTQLTDCLFSFLMQKTTIIRFGGRGGVLLFPLRLSIASVSNGPDHSPCPKYPPLWLNSPWNGSSSHPSDLPPPAFNPTVVTIPVFLKGGYGSIVQCRRKLAGSRRVGSWT
jgi:hypothetical protein